MSVGFQSLAKTTRRGQTTKITWSSLGAVPDDKRLHITYEKRGNKWTMKFEGETSILAPSQAAQIFRQIRERLLSLLKYQEA